MKSIRRVAIALTSTCMIVAGAHAQSVQDMGPAPLWTPGSGNPGFFATGRLTAIVCSPTDPEKYFVSGPGSGVWRRDETSPGISAWTPLTDHMPMLAVGALALDPNDEETIYAGTGDPEFIDHSPHGLGIYKSTDNGANWTHLGESVFGGRCISRIVIRPGQNQDPSTTIYASVVRAGGFPEASAAKMHPGRFDQCGVYRSLDAGVTWTQLTNGLPSR